MGEPPLPPPSSDYFSDPLRDFTSPSPSSFLAPIVPAPHALSHLHPDDHGLGQPDAGSLNRLGAGVPTQLSPIDAVSSTSLPVLHVRSPSASTPTHSLNAAGFLLHNSQHHTQVAPGPRVDMLGSTLDESTSPAPTPPAMRSSLSAISIRSQYSASPGSAISSPALAAMTDITPLPSPLLPGDSPGFWKRPAGPRPESSGSLGSLREDSQVGYFCAPRTSSPSRNPSVKKKKAYSSLLPAAVEASGMNAQIRKHEIGHIKHRSLSEFTPDPAHNVRPRNATFSGNLPADANDATRHSNNMQREEYLGEQRGFVSHPLPPPAKPLAALPTPPSSNRSDRSVTESEGEEHSIEETPPVEMMIVRDQRTGRTMRYRPVRPLGQGTFSKVVLATSQKLPATYILNETSEPSLDPKHLVAIKIVEHGPAGGADEERVELSLNREIEILQSISHPSLINLRAFDINDAEALLVLGYCPGGDLFEVASQHQETLTPPVVQRIFAEMVDAARHLHLKWIVHRDIKLENVLLNVPVSVLSTIASPQTYPRPLITLTDLGLSRHLPQPPASPLLTTRCGSEDYAAPEILLSQPYDGRSTDAWALGVLLYALMEGRLPFDPPPPRPGSKVARGRSRAAHRIARCDWTWSRFGDDDGDWDGVRGKGWEGGRVVVEGLLKKVSRGRWSLDEVAKHEWVAQGIQVDGGITRLDEENEAVPTGR